MPVLSLPYSRTRAGIWLGRRGTCAQVTTAQGTLWSCHPCRGGPQTAAIAADRNLETIQAVSLRIIICASARARHRSRLPERHGPSHQSMPSLGRNRGAPRPPALLTPVSDTNGLGHHRSDLDALETSVQIRDALGHLCDILQAAGRSCPGRRGRLPATCTCRQPSRTQMTIAELDSRTGRSRLSVAAFCSNHRDPCRSEMDTWWTTVDVEHHPGL
jgi:hypothetical protein